MGHNREDSEEDLDGIEVVLLFTVFFFFLTLFFKSKPEGDTNAHTKRMGLFGEAVDEIFCLAPNSPWILGLGVFKDACEV